jgi:hypothetical protein
LFIVYFSCHPWGILVVKVSVLPLHGASWRWEFVFALAQKSPWVTSLNLARIQEKEIKNKGYIFPQPRNLGDDDSNMKNEWQDQGFSASEVFPLKATDRI